MHSEEPTSTRLMALVHEHLALAGLYVHAPRAVGSKHDIHAHRDDLCLYGLYLANLLDRAVFIRSESQGIVYFLGSYPFTIRDIENYFDYVVTPKDAVLKTGGQIHSSKEVGKLFHYCTQLVKLRSDGCEKLCSEGIPECFSHLGEEAPEAQSGLLDAMRNSFYFTDISPSLFRTEHFPRNSNAICLSPNLRTWSRYKEKLSPAFSNMLQHAANALTKKFPALQLVSSRKVTFEPFCEKIPNLRQIDFDVYDRACTYFRDNAVKAAASRKFRKEHCSQCAIRDDCDTTWTRRVCTGQIRAEDIKQHVLKTIQTVYGGIPRINNKHVQRMLKLSGLVFQYKENGKGRGTRCRILSVGPRGKVILSRDWGCEYTFAENLESLLSVHSTLRKELGKTDIRLTPDQKNIFLYLSHFRGLRPKYNWGSWEKCCGVQILSNGTTQLGISRWQYPRVQVGNYSQLHTTHVGLDLMRDMRAGERKW